MSTALEIRLSRSPLDEGSEGKNVRCFQIQLADAHRTRTLKLVFKFMFAKVTEMDS